MNPSNVATKSSDAIKVPARTADERDGGDVDGSGTNEESVEPAQEANR